jgi:hypothetical protein
VSTPDAVGYPLHLVDSLGRTTASFGGQHRIAGRDDRVAIRRKLAAAPGRKFWVSHEGRFHIEKYNEDLEVELTFVGDRELLPASDGYIRQNPDSAFTPLVVSIVEAADGTLRLLGWAPAATWRDGWTQAIGPDGKSRPHVADYDKVYDSILEIIDIQTGTLLSRLRLNGFFLQFIDPDHVVSYQEDQLGFPVIRVWRLEFEK